MWDSWGTEQWLIAAIGAAGVWLLLVLVLVAVLRGERAEHRRRGAHKGHRPWNRRPRTP